MSWVTIKSSHYETDLLPLKSRLEAEGIQCFLRNEHTTQVMSHMATFVAELQVAKEDMEKVREIMTEIEKA
ncbi:putative signal transducing protein [Flagellimonas sediminis]|uniref:DUF2007 domain-containing protein n=1 Tax=Flagellimonas sediminis TaxID=2696468 RepID=A0A6I5L326_9FLAO|nr:DUF2007 domain-containing protein [Allomuricauda sediminis]NDV43390.1 hypothetical protein [Allomuricauda sediminis]